MPTVGKPAHHVNRVDLSRTAELDAAIELMHFAYRAMIAGPDRLLARRRLTRVHHRILHFVRRTPGLSINALLRTLGVSKQALNLPLRQLVDRGLIVHARSERDARVKELSLTADGRRLEARLAGLQRKHFDAVFRAAGRDAEAAWRRVTGALAAPELKKAGRSVAGGG